MNVKGLMFLLVVFLFSHTINDDNRIYIQNTLILEYMYAMVIKFSAK